MRSVLSGFVFVLMFAACATNPARDQLARSAAKLGIPKEEVAAIARRASETNQMFVIGAEVSVDGAIVLRLSHRKRPPHAGWREVTYRKIDGRWQEDTKARRDAIVKKAEQGARANASVRHAACYVSRIEMKPRKVESSSARGAPATVVAHL